MRQQGQHRPSLTLTMTLIPDSQSVADAGIFGSERMYVRTNYRKYLSGVVWYIQNNYSSSGG